MRCRNIVAVLLALLAWLGSISTAEAAGRGYALYAHNSMTGTHYGTGYNSYTGGAYYHGGAAYNPYTGRAAAGRSYYNPYTNTYRQTGAAYNPYTGRYAYGTRAVHP